MTNDERLAKKLAELSKAYPDEPQPRDLPMTLKKPREAEKAYPTTDQPPRDPETPEEWQEAADGANFLLAIDSARQYGLIEGGPTIHVERCDEILAGAAKRGITPCPVAAQLAESEEGKADA